MAKKPVVTEAEPILDPPAIIDDGKADYEILPNPPRFVALQLIRKGQTTIRLTEAEARAEVLAGHILLVGNTPSEAASKDI